MKALLLDGTELELEDGATGADAARAIGEGLARAALGIRVEGEMRDLGAPLEDGAKIVQSALDHFKRIDIIVNNAGILRDTTFHKMTQEDWDLIYRVHVLGSFRVTHAAWPHLRDQGYGTADTLAVPNGHVRALPGRLLPWAEPLAGTPAP